MENDSKTTTGVIKKMRALFRTCPKCGSKNIRHATVKTFYTEYNKLGVVQRWQQDASDAGNTKCLDCKHEETP